jgi:hypothetical protein
MTGALEKAVRPFQLPDAAVPRRIPSAQVEPGGAPITLEIGRGGSGKQFSSAWSFSHSRYCESHQVEKKKDKPF